MKRQYIGIRGISIFLFFSRICLAGPTGDGSDNAFASSSSSSSSSSSGSSSSSSSSSCVGSQSPNLLEPILLSTGAGPILTMLEKLEQNDLFNLINVSRGTQATLLNSSIVDYRLKDYVDSLINEAKRKPAINTDKLFQTASKLIQLRRAFQASINFAPVYRQGEMKKKIQLQSAVGILNNACEEFAAYLLSLQNKSNEDPDETTLSERYSQTMYSLLENSKWSSNFGSFSYVLISEILLTDVKKECSAEDKKYFFKIKDRYSYSELLDLAKFSRRFPNAQTQIEVHEIRQMFDGIRRLFLRCDDFSNTQQPEFETVINAISSLDGSLASNDILAASRDIEYLAVNRSLSSAQIQQLLKIDLRKIPYDDIPVSRRLASLPGLNVSLAKVIVERFKSPSYWRSSSLVWLFMGVITEIFVNRDLERSAQSNEEKVAFQEMLEGIYHKFASFLLNLNSYENQYADLYRFDIAFFHDALSRHPFLPSALRLQIRAEADTHIRKFLLSGSAQKKDSLDNAYDRLSLDGPYSFAQSLAKLDLKSRPGLLQFAFDVVSKIESEDDRVKVFAALARQMDPASPLFQRLVLETKKCMSGPLSMDTISDVLTVIGPHLNVAQLKDFRNALQSFTPYSGSVTGKDEDVDANSVLDKKPVLAHKEALLAYLETLMDFIKGSRDSSR